MPKKRVPGAPRVPSPPRPPKGSWSKAISAFTKRIKPPKIGGKK